jgi:hypothetical protein
MARNTRYRSGSNWPAGIGPKVTALLTVIGKGVKPIIVASAPEPEELPEVQDVQPEEPEVAGETMISRKPAHRRHK